MIQSQQEVILKIYFRLNSFSVNLCFQNSSIYLKLLFQHFLKYGGTYRLAFCLRIVEEKEKHRGYFRFLKKTAIFLHIGGVLLEKFEGKGKNEKNLEGHHIANKL